MRENVYLKYLNYAAHYNIWLQHLLNAFINNMYDYKILYNNYTIPA